MSLPGSLDEGAPCPAAGPAARRASERWRLPLIVLLAAVLRLAGLGSASLWYDEGASLYSGQYLSQPAALFDDAKHIEPPVNAVVTGLWTSVLHALSPTKATDRANDFLIRLLPCVFGILNVLLVHALAVRLFACRRTACFAALLFALAPFQVFYAQELRVYSLYTTVCLAAVWCAAAALAKNRLRYWIGYVAAAAGLMYCHYIAMWIIFAVNVAYVALLPTHRKLLGRWTAANAAVMILIAPALLRAFHLHAAVQDLEIPWYPNPTWKTGLITFKDFFAGYGPTAWAYRPLIVLALGLWAVGLRGKPSARAGIVLTACLTWIPIAGCVLLWGHADFSFYEHRLFIFSGVMAIVGVARGAALLGRWGYAVIAATSLLMLPGLADYYQGRLHPLHEHRLGVSDKVDFRSAAAALEARWQPGDRLVYATVFCAYSMYHYFPRDQVHIGWDLSLEDVYLKIYGHEALLREHRLMPVPREKAVAGATRIWFMTTHGVTFESEEFTRKIRTWLNEIAVETETLYFDGVSLHLFVPHTPGPPAGPAP